MEELEHPPRLGLVEARQGEADVDDDVLARLGVGHVLTWEGEGHTAYPSTPCIVKAVDNYLIGLTVPQEGLRCPAK